jgi:hypothetical protein
MKLNHPPVMETSAGGGIAAQRAVVGCMTSKTS